MLFHDIFLIICREIFVELHADNVAQATKSEPAKEIPEELPREEPPMEALEQAVEDKQETEETDKIIPTINEQVTNAPAFLFIKWALFVRWHINRRGRYVM